MKLNRFGALFSALALTLSLVTAPAHAASFSDVAPNSPDLPAVSWAVEKGVTNGYGSPDAFDPDKAPRPRHDTHDTPTPDTSRKGALWPSRGRRGHIFVNY